MNIHLIVDLSGSMSEPGKIPVIRNALRCVREWSFFRSDSESDCRFVTVAWNHTVIPIDITQDTDIVLPRPEGTANFSELADFFPFFFQDEEQRRLIFLSDGCYSDDECGTFQHHCKKLNISVRSVAVGADADLFMLKKISTDGKVYHSTDLTAVIESLVYEQTNRSKPPTFCSEVITV